MSARTTIRIAAVALAAPLALSLAVAPAAHAADSGVQAKKYTMTEVKKHNKATNCWTVVGTNVYNVTAWIPKHPGGSGVIKAMCGKNGTASFNSVHKSSGKAKASLARYKIGTL